MPPSSPALRRFFRPAHNQTVLCPVPPYGLSMMMLACYCRDLTRSERSGPAGRAGAAQAGQRSRGPFPVRGVPPRAAAPSAPWGTRVRQERTDHSPRPSNLSRSLWKRVGMLWSGRKRLLCEFYPAVRCYGGWHGSARSLLLSSATSKPGGEEKGSHIEIWADVNKSAFL